MNPPAAGDLRDGNEERPAQVGRVGGYSVDLIGRIAGAYVSVAYASRFGRTLQARRRGAAPPCTGPEAAPAQGRTSGHNARPRTSAAAPRGPAGWPPT